VLSVCSVVETAFHLPSGQDSVAILNFAHVEQPHLRHLPVPPSAAASHSGQARQVASRAARISGGVVVKPERANLVNAMPKFFMAASPRIILGISRLRRETIIN
jgi:hypothetical protein